MVGKVGADPTTPEETVLQTAAVADLLLSEIGEVGFYLLPTNNTLAYVSFANVGYGHRTLRMAATVGIEPTT